MVIDREKDIENFTPEEYWSIDAHFQRDKDAFEGFFYGVDGKKQELKNEQEVNTILGKLQDRKFTINKVNKRERKRNPAKPFTTQSMQHEAARKLNSRARKTMKVSQHLYEGIDRKSV